MGLWIPGGLLGEDGGGGGVKIVEWATGTDEQIVTMLEAHYAGTIDIHNYWTVGDTRQVTLSAMAATGVSETHAQQTVTLVLSNSGGKYFADEEGYITSDECAFQVDQVHSLNETGLITNQQYTNGGWRDCIRRTWCNDVYYNAIPETLRPIFKRYINQSGQGGGTTSGVYTTADYFALRAEIEVMGSVSPSVSGEGSQVDWYKTSANRIKQVNGTAAMWWLRSPRSNTNNQWCRITTTGTSDGIQANVYTYGLAPFGCI